MGFDRGAHEHSKCLDELLHKPSLIGIESLVVWSTKEINLFKPHSHQQLTDVDLFYQTNSGIYVAEYKNSRKHWPKAKKQLRLAEEWVEYTFKQSPQKIFVYTPQYYYDYL